ncbi:hypothetical protein [Rhizorhabdus wittichii]|uniref:hypothetical protein n=1 Tax=Rhizorhabdus wittichii TaxID=160791 RepID=UPI0012FDD273|nr:hypothetical protein [Rhizorhabdus wittichii]
MGRKKIRADQRADTRGGQWVGIPHVVVDSVAYRSLSDRAARILVELARRFNGYNNGSIALSQRELGEALHIQNYGSIGRAIAELVDRGLLAVALEGNWKERDARQYRLTFISTTQGGSHRPATNDYLSWTPSPRPAKSGAEHASAKHPIPAEHGSADGQNAAEDVSARIRGYRRKTAAGENPAAEDASSLIYEPYPDSGIGRSEHDTPESQNPAADCSVPDMTIVTSHVMSMLQAVRSQEGIAGVKRIAKAASLAPSRVVAFLEGADSLNGPLILLLRRALNAWIRDHAT